jgi:hypothetical protein
MSYREPGGGLERELEELREQASAREARLDALRPGVIPRGDQYELSRARRRAEARAGDLLQQLDAATRYLQLLDELVARIPALLARFGSYSAEAPSVKDLRAGHGVVSVEPCDARRSTDTRLHELLGAISPLDRRAAFFSLGDRERPDGFCTTFEREGTSFVAVYPAQLPPSVGVRAAAVSVAVAVPPWLPAVSVRGGGSPRSNPLVALVVDGLRDLLRRRSATRLGVPEIDHRLTIETDETDERGKELLLRPAIRRQLARLARMVAPGLALTVREGIAELSWYGAVLDHEHLRTALDCLAALRGAEPLDEE